MENCIFCKIVSGQIPAKKVHEDDLVVVFNDIHPWAPVHLLVVPRQHIESMAEVGEAHRDLMGHMMVLAPKLVAAQGVSDGFRQVINTGRNGGQEVFHLHMHVLAGPRPWAKG